MRTIWPSTTSPRLMLLNCASCSSSKRCISLMSGMSLTSFKSTADSCPSCPWLLCSVNSSSTLLMIHDLLLLLASLACSRTLGTLWLSPAGPNGLLGQRVPLHHRHGGWLPWLGACRYASH